jgi:hypothetical protein
MMNHTQREIGTMAGPLIFTVPAYGFVMALYLDCLGRTPTQELPKGKLRQVIEEKFTRLRPGPDFRPTVKHFRESLKPGALNPFVTR